GGGGRSGGRRCYRGGRGEDRVRGSPHERRRQEDQRDQGRARGHQPRPQGGQGPGGRRPQGRQGGRLQGGGRDDQEEVRGSRGPGRDQVARDRKSVVQG